MLQEVASRKVSDSFIQENRSSDSIVNIFLPFACKQTFLKRDKLSVLLYEKATEASGWWKKKVEY